MIEMMKLGGEIRTVHAVCVTDTTYPQLGLAGNPEEKKVNVFTTTTTTTTAVATTTITATATTITANLNTKSNIYIVHKSRKGFVKKWYWPIYRTCRCVCLNE